MKHEVLPPVRDPERLAALARTALLDSPPEESFDRLARLASRLLGARIALVSLVAEDRQFFTSCFGLAEPWATRRELPLSHSFCRHALDSAEPLILDDAREHPLFRDNPAITALGVIAYAGIPLVTADGHALGSFCVLDTRPRHWTAEQIEVLTELAASAMTEIRLREGIRAARAQEVAEGEARRQFEDLVQGLDAIVWEMDVASFRFTFVSDRAEHLLGYPVRRWVEEPTFWQDVLLHPEDRDWALDFCQSATRDSRDHELEYRAVRADGETVWLRDLVRVVCDEAGRPCRLRGVMVDISEQKKAVQELRKREAQLTEAQMVARIGSWEVDIETDTLTWSDESYRLCGLEPQSAALTTERFLELVHPDDRDRVQQAIRHALERGEPYCIEARMLLGDGSVRHTQLRGEAVTDRQGRPIRLRGTGQDITERKLAEEARRRAEEDARTMASRMRAVAEAASGVIGADTVDKLVPILHDACKEVISFDCFYLCQYEEDAHSLAFAVGYDSGDLVPATTVAAAGTPSERVILSRRSLLTRRSSDPGAEGAVPIGSGRNSESIIRVPVLSGARVLGVLSVQSYTPDLYTERDIEVLEAIASLVATALVNIELLEELRASEASYRTIFNASHDAIYIHDLDTGALLDINRRCYEMHGYAKEELLALGVGGVADGTPPYDAEHALRHIRKAAAGEPQRFEWLARHRNGDGIWGDVYLQRVNILGQDRLLAAVRDITKRKQTEEALVETERLAQSMASRMRAVAGAAAGVIGANSVDALQEVLREECRRVMSFDAFTMALYDPAEHTLAHLEGFDGDIRIAAETISAAGTPGERVIRTRKSLLTRRSSDPEAVGALPMGSGRRSESIIRTPILGGERVLGLLSVQSYTPDLYTEQDVEVLEAIASLAATALLNLELSVEREAAEEALRHANEELEQRVAERTAELQQRTAELEAVFQALPDLYFRLAADGTVLDYRAGDEDRLLPPEQFLGRSLTDMLHDMPVDVGVRLREGIEEVNRTGRLVCVEYPLTVDDVSCEFEARLLPLADGSLIAIVRDITDRKQAEEELKKREEHFRRLIENAHDFVEIVDLDGTTRYISPAVQRILGYAPEELIGTAGVLLADRSELEIGRAKLAEAAANPGTTVPGEFRARHKDGSLRVLETFARTLAPDSADEGIVINARDLTEHKQFEAALQEREEWFRSLIENAHDMVQVVDADNTTLYVSPSVERILGFAPDELIGRVNPLETHPDDVQRGADLLAETVANPGLTSTGEFRVRHRDGSWHWLETYGRTLSPTSADQGIVANLRDVTERKHFEEALREREEHFRRLIENAYDVVLVMDAAGTITYASPSAQRVLGSAPEELTGRSGFSLLHPDDVDTALARTTETVATPGTVVSAELRLRHHNGSYRTLETFCRTLADDSAASGIVINARDITERKEFEEALQDSEARYRSLIENAHDIVTILDLEGRITYQSPQLERVLGYEPAEMLGQNALEYVHPEDRHLPTQALQQIFACPGATYISEYRFRHSDGSWRYLETFGRALVPDSPHQGLVFNSRDVTERRGAEEELKRQRTYFEQLLASVDAGVAAWDVEGRFEYASPNSIPDPEIRGWIIGKTHFEYCEKRGLPVELAERRSGSIRRAIETRTTSEYEETIHRPDGTPLHLLRRNRPILDEAGEVERVIGYSVDITERKRTEEAVRCATEEAERAREAAERANRAKSEFLSRMSHELRTPMNSILGFAQLLDRAQLSPEHKKGVGHILKAGRHLLQLINEVLEIARIEAGRHSLSLEPVRLGAVLQEAVALVRPLAAQWRVELDDGPWPCCAVFVQADRQRLTQVLLNLLGNAIKYNRAGGRVRVSCEIEAEGERQHLVVRVQDTGRGIAADKADQLFTPFARLGAEQSEVEGTGLGLALSQRLTEAMGGSLTLESSGIEGSVFRLDLQVTTDPLRRLEESEAVSASLDGVPHAPATLLYIEDNLANLSLVETILLSRPHWWTMPALQGQIGVELAREHTPDLILLDLHLPDISGEEVLRRLRAEPRTAAIPVVVITADATRSTVDRLRAAGADAYLTKPLDIDEFLETVERFLPSPE
jgi:PAS domain S-box-containing protein